MTLTRRGNATEGSFSAAQLRAVRIPLSAVQLEPARVRWELRGDSTTVVAQGRLSGDALAGTFTEGKGSGTFSLRRVAASRFAAREEEIAFAGAGGDALAGAIVWPTGDGPFPGVVFLHGSGPEGRWASRYLAYEFARSGIAALVYDKRGVGASKGDWKTAGFEELVMDSSAAVDVLRARLKIGVIGIHGHSQGGTLAPWVAATNRNVWFVIASAASGVSMAEAEIFSLDNAMKVSTLPPDDRRLAERFVRALVASAYNGAPRAELDAAAAEARDKPWMIAVPPDSSPYWAFSRRIAAYDPGQYWRQVTVPALLVYGERDERVPVSASISAIRASARRKPDQIIVFPEADHGFRVKAPDAAGFAWPQNAPGYPDLMIGWIHGVLSR